MKIIVDTNIVFSGLLNSTSAISKFLIYPNSQFQFYTCEFLRVEILKHRKKLLKLTNLSEEELNELWLLVTGNITFINDGLIPEKLLVKTAELLRSIDPNDTPFVALAKHLGGVLWTGDLHLYNGLKSKRFKEVITTQELSIISESIEKQ